MRSKRRQAKTRKSKRLLPLRLGDNVTTTIKPRTAWVQVHTHLAIAPPLIQNFGAPEDVVLISIKTKKRKMSPTNSTNIDRVDPKSETSSTSLSLVWTKRRRQDRQRDMDHLPSCLDDVDGYSSCGSITSRSSTQTSTQPSLFTQDESVVLSQSSLSSSRGAGYKDVEVTSASATPRISNSRRSRKTKRCEMTSWMLIFLMVGLAASFYSYQSMSSIRSTLLLLWDNEYYHTRHPLYFHRRPQNPSRIRYLTLGSSTSWGLGLESYDDTREKITKTRRRQKKRGHLQAYPYLLSPRVHNAANKRGGLEISALCTESIVGSKHVYDVIVLEFSFETTNGEGLTLLAQRIRQRFPHATIIFVQLWLPSQFYTTITTASLESFSLPHDGNSNNFTTPTKISFDEMRSTSSDPDQLSLYSDKFEVTVKEHQWEFKPNDQHEADLQAVAALVQGDIVRLPLIGDASSTLASAKELFFELDKSDLKLDENNKRVSTEYALTPTGHKLIANKIRAIVDEKDILSQPKEFRNAVGTWGSGDQCWLWYETGKGMPSKYSRLRFRQFSKSRNKYALEVPTTSTSSTVLSTISSNKRRRRQLKAAVGGSLTVSNPFPDERMVYLTYMTSSSEPSSEAGGNDFSGNEDVYPRTQVILNGKPTVILDPYHANREEMHHLTRTTAIGFIPAKTSSNVIEFTSLQQGKSKSFRIVGVSLFPNERRNYRIATEFSMSAEPARNG